MKKQLRNAVCLFECLMMLYKYQTYMQQNQNIINQKPQRHSSSTSKAELAVVQPKSPTHSLCSQQIRFLRYAGEKNKKIKRKPQSIIQKLRIEAPISFQHVSNFLNMLSINERSMQDKSFEQSYFRSIFYIKSVEKVQVRKNALILYLKNSNNLQIQSEKHKIQYLVQRYRSFGDRQFYQLAQNLETAYRKYTTTNFNVKLKNCCDSQPLSRFIQSMHDRIYGCKVAPNKLIISRGLLELLGEDMQNFALRLCKYKTPMQEIISCQQYSAVMNKSIQSISLLCDFLQQKIDFQTLQKETYLQFYDYLCSRKQKRIYCKIKLYMPTPLLQCLQAIDVKNECQLDSHVTALETMKKKLLTQEVQQIRFRQTLALKHLITLQDNMLTENKSKVAGIMQLSQGSALNEIMTQ